MISQTDKTELLERFLHYVSFDTQSKTVMLSIPPVQSGK